MLERMQGKVKVDWTRGHADMYKENDEQASERECQS